MKQIFVLFLCLCMIALCGCGAIGAVSPAVTTAPTLAPEPTPTITPTPSPEPTPTPAPTPEPTPSPTPAPDPDVSALVRYSGVDYWISVTDVGANEAGKVTVTLRIHDFGQSVSYIAGKPQYPMQLRIMTEKREFPWVKAEMIDGQIVYLFNTDLPPVTIVAYPQDAPQDEAAFAYFDGVSLRVTTPPQAE